MRDLIDIITERGLTPAELGKHEGAYLQKLIDLATEGPVATEPSYIEKLGPEIQLSTGTIESLKASLETGSALPSKPLFVNNNGQEYSGAWGAINKGAEYTGLEAKKTYNAGHLAELFMGLAVSANFFNLGDPITVDLVIEMFKFAEVGTHINPKTNKVTSNVVFTISQDIVYPATIKGQPDHLIFRGVIPGNSANAFIEQVNSGNYTADIQAVLASAVRYVNESASVKTSITQVQQDPNTNQINVTSDGTSDAKMTKADLVLSVDGKKINLFSLKTYGSDTLGQISGVGFDQVNQWFSTSFGIDLSKYRDRIDNAKTPAEGFKILLKLYDVIYPEIETLVDHQTPGQESNMVKKFAEAAKYHARGASGEDVEIVKLDDKIKTGNYKILKFSDDLYDAMKELDLETRMLKGDNNRTVQIWVKPDDSKGMEKANKLCQFRTQKMGKSYRNYFESGIMLEKLTQINKDAEQEKETDQPGIRRSSVKAAPEEPEKLGTNAALGRKRQR
jgi:hypothetical protein